MQKHVSSLPVFYDAETGEHWVSAVFSPLPCGCTVAGAGNLPSPLRVKPCATHAVEAPVLERLLSEERARQEKRARWKSDQERLAGSISPDSGIDINL